MKPTIEELEAKGMSPAEINCWITTEDIVKEYEELERKIICQNTTTKLRNVSKEGNKTR